MVLFLILLLPVWGVISEVSHQTLSATCGGSTLFQVNLSKHLEINSIFWSRNASGHKSMLAIAKPDIFKVIDNRFRNRASLQPGFSLRLGDLQEEDNGIYEAQIYTNEHTVIMYFNLQVYDETVPSSRVPANGHVRGRNQGSSGIQQEPAIPGPSGEDSKKGLEKAKEPGGIGKNESHRTQWTWRNLLGGISLGTLITYMATKV